MRGKDGDSVHSRLPFRITPAYAGKSSTLLPNAQAITGSPPPMRGKVPSILYHISYNRITPAYAGKSAHSTKCGDSSGDHPRLCGEKVSNFHSLEFAPGSPPPMRGKVSNSPTPAFPPGITPAYAGKSSIVSPSSAVDWDHPRLCGEKYPLACYHLLYIGSPPPMRGKVTGVFQQIQFIRITPAYAGKSLKCSTQSDTLEDHPRLCGEKLSGKFVMICLTGSPPPMRGKAISSKNGRGQTRITPAYAGKSFFATNRGTEFRDHPRLCGEKIDANSVRDCGGGSPPPMRGKAQKQACESFNDRITPAYAGKSSDRHLCAVYKWDHPRLCGEKRT